MYFYAVSLESEYVLFRVISRPSYRLTWRCIAVFTTALHQDYVNFMRAQDSSGTYWTHHNGTQIIDIAGNLANGQRSLPLP